MALRNGTRIGNYEILGPLGSGGMGEVYRARDRRLRRNVAVKALPEGLTRDAKRLALLEREAKLLASLNHPNIAGIFGIEDFDGSSYLILEYIDGETLARRITRGAIPYLEAIGIGIQIASAIEAAHERGVIHRDLKPGNIMLTRSRVVKVLDFGLAKAGVRSRKPSHDPSMTTLDATTETAEGSIIGTPRYMSPEQARGQAVDRMTDVWALGCILFECLSGRPAFSGETSADLIAQILGREPDWGALPAHTPSRLRDVMQRCLTKSPGARPRAIGDLRRELTAIEAEATQSTAAPLDISSPSAVAKPSLAVLYFENLSSDSDSEYFCAGITEDILTDLSKIKGMRVASRNAVLRFRGRAVDIRKVAAELRVNAILEGSVRRVGERVRISAQLINPADGFHLWAERYDRTLEDVFAVQEEIARAIAAALRVALSPADTERLGLDRPDDIRAYDLYLRGREHYGRYTLDSILQALELFRQAAAVDPSYALAFAGIADCYGQMLQLGRPEDPAGIERLGLEAARRAIALNPKLAEGHKAESLVLGYMGDLDGSRAALRRAIDADPRHTPALANFGVATLAAGDVATAERLIRRALDLDPQNAMSYLWIGLVWALTDRFDEALRAMDRVRTLSSDAIYVTASHLNRILIHLMHGDDAAAERSLREGFADSAQAMHLRAGESWIAARRGQMEEARSLLIQAESSADLGMAALLSAVAAAVHIGEPARAVRLLRRNLLLGLQPVLVRLVPALHPLLEIEPFAPRRCDLILVWPREAPPIDPTRAELFREVRIQSGVPKGDDPMIEP